MERRKKKVKLNDNVYCLDTLCPPVAPRLGFLGFVLPPQRMAVAGRLFGIQQLIEVLCVGVRLFKERCPESTKATECECH